MLRKTPNVGALGLLFIILQSCSNESTTHSAGYSESVSADTTAVVSASETAAIASEDVPALASADRKIIRKADIRCRVNDVYTATSGIEKLVSNLNGIVSESRMENQASETKQLPYNADSLRQIRSVVTTAHITLKVPVGQLDTLLSAIATQAAFIDTRSLQLNDVTLQYLSNELKTRASTENNAAQKASALTRKTSDAMVAGQYADQRDKEQINRKIENMSLKEQATFATLTLDVYQPERMDQLIIPNMEQLLMPSFTQRAKGALGNGFAGLQLLFVVMMNVWPLWIIALIVLYILKARKVKWMGFGKPQS